MEKFSWIREAAAWLPLRRVCTQINHKIKAHNSTRGRRAGWLRVFVGVSACWAHTHAAPLGLPAPAAYAPLPAPVASFGAAIHEGWLLVYGGHLGGRHEYSSNEVSGACRRLSLSDGSTWESLASSLPAQSPGVAAHGGYLYRVGGMAARNAKGQKPDLHSYAAAERFNLRSGAWEPLPPLPEPRSSHDVVMVGSTLYVIGGWQLSGGTDSGQWIDTACRLDVSRPGAEWETLPQPFKRRGLCLAALGPKIYCIGGMTDGDSTSLAVDIYDTASGQWSKGPNLPQGKLRGFGNAACVAEGRLYVNGLSGILWRLSVAGDAWEEAGRLRTARFFHRLLPGGPNQLLAIGGESENGKLKDIEVISLAPVSAREWPQFRGPNRDGISAETAWSATWPAEGPAVLWRRQLGRGISSFAVQQGRVLTLGNANDTDTLWCLDAQSGEVLWRYDYPCLSTNHPMPIVPYGPAATPTIAGGNVYSLSREGDFFCLEAASGRILWQTHLLKELGGKRPVYGYANSVLVAGGLVFLDVGGARGSTVALDATTGAVRWQKNDGEAGYSSARIVHHREKAALACFKGEALTLLDPETGAQLASYPTTTRDFCNTITPAVAGNRIFVSNTGKEGTVCLDFSAGPEPRVVWRKADLGLLFNSPILWHGRLYAFNDAQRNVSELVCLDAATGETRWTFSGVDKGVFTVADHRMILLTSRGELVILTLDDQPPKTLARAQVLGGKCYAEPVLVDGRIYCRNNDGQMVCLDVRDTSRNDQVMVSGLK